MKKITASLILAAVILIPMTGCKKSPVAVVIDDDKISISDFERFYYTQNRLLLNLDTKDDVDKMAQDPSLAGTPVQRMLQKPSYMDQLIAQHLLYRKAMGDKTLNKEELDTVIELATMQTVAQYYLAKKLKSEITVTNEEVEQFYNENRAQFKGVPINDRIFNQIRQNIYMQKSEMKSQEYIRRLMDESKVIREGFDSYVMEESKKRASQEQNLPPVQVPNTPAPDTAK